MALHAEAVDIERSLLLPPNNVEGKDVFLCNLESKTDYNGVGGRCMKYLPKEGRYSVRIHGTGKTLSVKPSCVVEQVHPAVNWKSGGSYILPICAPGRVNMKKKNRKGEERDRIYTVKEEDVSATVLAHIEKNDEVRRQLSLRVKEGLLKKGPGALIANLYDVNEAVPTVLDNADAVLQPNQTVWMSNKELTQKFGRAWTHGGKECGLDKEWPALVKSAALFARILSFDRWEDTMASAPDEIECEKDYYNRWGVFWKVAVKVIRRHVARRMVFQHHPPMTPENGIERALIAHFHIKGGYDGICEVWNLSGTDKDGALWNDHDEMNGYQDSSSFYLLSFKSLPFFVEEHVSVPHAIDGTGWQVLSFSAVPLWCPDMDDGVGQAACDDEALHNGESFRALPSSCKETIYHCGNPDCNKTATKKKSPRQQRSKRTGTALLHCARCQKERYCSRPCQKADWKRHKKICGS